MTHERAIVVRADNSVVRALDGAPAYLRRARGFVPDPIDLGADGPSVIAAGGDLKNTITVTRGREAFVSQHIGDLDDRETIRFRDETIRHLTSILEVEPQMRGLRSSSGLRFDPLGGSRPACRSIAVQHHVAHVAAVVAEKRWSGEPLLGVALDGHGYGADGAPWGGELIVLDGARWDARRLARAARARRAATGRRASPGAWASRCSHRLGRLGRRRAHASRGPEAARLADAFARGARFAGTTSLGRLFDAAAALAGVCLRQHYEGQAAMELEALVATPRIVPGGWTIADGRLDLAPMVETMLRRTARGPRRGRSVPWNADRRRSPNGSASTAVAREVFDARRARRRMPDESRARRRA